MKDNFMSERILASADLIEKSIEADLKVVICVHTAEFVNLVLEMERRGIQSYSEAPEPGATSRPTVFYRSQPTANPYAFLHKTGKPAPGSNEAPAWRNSPPQEPGWYWVKLANGAIHCVFYWMHPTDKKLWCDVNGGSSPAYRNDVVYVWPARIEEPPEAPELPETYRL